MDALMASAYEDVKNNGLSIRAAAEKHGVTRELLRQRMKNPVPRPVGRPGHQLLSDFDEELLVKLPLYSASCLLPSMSVMPFLTHSSSCYEI